MIKNIFVSLILTILLSCSISKKGDEAIYIDYDTYRQSNNTLVFKRDIIDDFNAQNFIFSDIDRQDISQLQQSHLQLYYNNWGYFPREHIHEIQCHSFMRTPMTELYFFLQGYDPDDYEVNEMFPPLYCNTISSGDFTVLYYFSLEPDFSSYLTHRYDIYLFHREGFFRSYTLDDIEFPYEYWTLGFPFFGVIDYGNDGLGDIISFDGDIRVKDQIIHSRFHEGKLKEFFQEFEQKVLQKLFEK